jgi:plasmid stability protein
MGQMLIRQIDESVMQRLKLRARANRRSTESEVRTILEEAVKPSESRNQTLKSFAGAARSGQSFRTLDEIVAHIRALREEQDG